jgi:epoxyqueuosine reductase
LWGFVIAQAIGCCIFIPVLIQQHTQRIKAMAQQLGFDACGIATAQPLDAEARKLEQWLNAGMHGQMHYMANHFDLRINPQKLVPGAQSVITLLLNYFPEKVQPTTELKISKYAYGKDYHLVIREKLHALLHLIKESIGDVQGRGFVDSAPVLERAWAVKSGLGWVGKNGNLITKQQGSFFFIATLIVDLPLQPDDAFAKDFCGTCTRCIDACPTDAILPNKVVDGGKCISYYTIELKAALLPATQKGKFDNWMFGCDTCQDVCPWNRFSQPTQTQALAANPAIFEFSLQDWQALTKEKFDEVFKDSPIQRTKYEGIMRNLRFLAGDE